MTELINHDQDISSIVGWQEQFPLPNSLYNPEFGQWAHCLNRSSQLQLREEMLTWYTESMTFRTEIETRFRGSRMLLDHFDTFIGNLTFDKDPNFVRRVDLLKEGRTFRVNICRDYVETIEEESRKIQETVEAGRHLTWY